ncbi:LOW QUALITY PROTEIN: hypothetical protein CFOL_v3_34654, partial [Cephalotus follicularis]
IQNLCTIVAYLQVRGLIHQERLKDLEKKRRAAEGQNLNEVLATQDDRNKERVISLRPLNLKDFRETKNQVVASFAAEGSIMAELKQNDSLGERGSRKKEQLTYFL